MGRDAARQAYRLVVVVWVWLLAGVTHADEANPPSLWDVLAARGGAVQTFRADVRITPRPGADRGRLADAQTAYLQWRRTHFPGESEEPRRKYIAALRRNAVAASTFYHYYAKMPDKIRFELYKDASSGGTGGLGQLGLEIYTGDRWESDYRASHPKNAVIVGRQASNNLPLLEIARGAAADTWELEGCSAATEATKQVHWSELLGLLDRATATESQKPLPGRKVLRPFLEVRSKRHTGQYGNGRRLYRLRLWFEPAHDYLPRRMECQYMSLNGEGYVPSKVVEWSGFTRLSDGSEFAKQCVERRYDPFQLVEPDKPQESWTTRAYEVIVNQFEFTDVHVNQPLDDALFKMEPTRGTFVIDQVSGYQYTVGSAGQQLRKTALDSSEDHAQTASARWRLLLGAGLAALLLAILGRYTYRRWRGTFPSAS